MYRWISLLRFIVLYLPYIHNIHSLSRKNDDFRARVCGATEICVTDRTSRCNRTISMQRCVKHWRAPPTHTHTHTHPLQHQSRRNCGAILHRRLRFRVMGVSQSRHRKWRDLDTSIHAVMRQTLKRHTPTQTLCSTSRAATVKRQFLFRKRYLAALLSPSGAAVAAAFPTPPHPQSVL